jgi:hypothetical protein
MSRPIFILFHYLFSPLTPPSPLHTCPQGDALVDAAIEAYAADRDVTEFLDTLQILSSHTPEGEG